MLNTSGDHTKLIVRVNVAGLDPQRASAMALTIATQGIDDALQSAGYVTREIYVGKKSAGALEVIKEIALMLYTNKDLIIALVGIATPITSHLLKKREEKNS